MKNKKEKTQNSNEVILYGRHAVLSALHNKHRKINKLYCTAENSESIRAVLKAENLGEGILKIVDRKEIEKILPAQSVHQGLVLFCSKLDEYTIEELCENLQDKAKSTILILDQVTDPQNIGTIIRSCAAFDCDALIMQDRNSPQETGAIAKAAVGAMEILPIVRATNLSRAIEKLKDCGFWIVGMDGYADKTLDSLDKGGKIAIVMGSEGRGMRRLIEESCDINIKLPMSEKVESLNVATAASIVLYERYK